MLWPDGKSFAFSIIDDTDLSNVANVKPVYDYLYEKGIRTTKTVWVEPPRDNLVGETLRDEGYLDFVKQLKERGFEIALHGAGSGDFLREETISALQYFKECLDQYPRIQVNHGVNKDAIYWGAARFCKLFSAMNTLVHKGYSSRGHVPGSEYFWGDVCKEHIDYIRNRCFPGINTLKYDPKMPYTEPGKEACSNNWFSASSGEDVAALVKLLSGKNVDTLERQGGACIVYTHFAFGFVDENGCLRKEFKDCIDALSARNGWFVPVSTLLDYLKSKQGARGAVSPLYPFRLDILELWGSIFG